MAAMGDVRPCWWTLTAALAILVAGSGAAGVEGHGCGQSVHHFNSDEVPFGPLTLVRGLQLRGGSVYALQPPRHIQVVLDGPGEPFKMFLGSFLLEHNPQENIFERPLVDQSVAMQADGVETDPFERAMHLFSSVHLQTRILDIDRIHSELRTAALQRLHRELQWRESQRQAEVVAREASAARLEDDTVTSQRSGFWDNIRNGITSKLRAFQEEPEMAAVQRQQGSQEADELFGLFHRAHAAASSSFFGCLAVGVAVALLCSLVFSCLTALCCQCPSEEEEATLVVVSSPEMISTPLLTTVEHEDSQAAEEGIIQNPLVATPAYQPPLVHPSTDK